MTTPQRDDLEHELAESGHLAELEQLLADGHSRRQIIREVRHVHTWGHPVRFSSLRPFTISEVFGPDDLVRGCMTCPEVVR